MSSGRGRGCWGGEGDDFFPFAFQGLAGLSAEGESRLSARRGSALAVSGRAGGGGTGGRHCALRPGQAFVPPTLSALSTEWMDGMDGMEWNGMNE